MGTILIPDPVDLPQTAALRGLGRRGYICDVAWPQTRFEAYFNGRYCRDVISVPSAEQHPADFAEAILDLCSHSRYDAVIPTRGSSVEALAPVRERLSEITSVLLPTREQFEIGLDKIRTLLFCQEFDVPYPRSEVIGGNVSAKEIVKSFYFPLVLKHRRNIGASIGVRMVRCPREMESAIQELMPISGRLDDLLVQEFIPGTLFDVCIVAREGKIAGQVMQARRLMYPISGGVGANLVTVDYMPLAEAAEHVVSSLNWTGPAQLEFKWDKRRGQFTLIEINPRFWGTTGAWLKAGANFPELVVRLATGQPVENFPSLRPGLRFRYLLGRTPMALIQLWRTKGFAATRESVSYERSYNDIDVTDPLPDLWRLYRDVREIVRGREGLCDKSLPIELIQSLSNPILNGRR